MMRYAASRPAWAISVVLLSGVAAHAYAQSGPDALVRRVSPESRLDDLDVRVREGLQAVLAGYDDEIEQHPYDLVLRTDKCRFIDEFTFEYEYLEWLEEAYTLADQCVGDLMAEFPDHPEVVLLDLERRYGEDLLFVGRELDTRAQWAGWTAGQMARFYESLATSADLVGDSYAPFYAARALELDESVNVRLIAASGAMSAGDRNTALETLMSPLIREPEEAPWQVLTRVQLLTELGEHEAAVSAYESLAEREGFYDRVSMARALRDANAIELARLEFERAVEEGIYTYEDERALFEFEYRFGSAEQALAAYLRWRDLGWEQDPILINRISLLFKDARLPWQPRDFLGLVGAVWAAAAIALLALVPIVAAHYCGLVRRARLGELNQPTPGWQLEHAWGALFALGMAGFFSIYMGGPADVLTETGDVWAIDVTVAQTARPAVVQWILGGVFVAPFVRAAAFRQPIWPGERWTWGKSLAFGIGIALLFRAPAFLAYSAVADELWRSLVQENLMWQVLAAVREEFGVGIALAIVAIAAPLVEEFVFRGIVLSALSKQMAFGWANTVQASMFAALHFDLAAMPYLFVFGIVAGLLTRRSGSLTAATAMHCVFNLAMAALVFF